MDKIAFLLEDKILACLIMLKGDHKKLIKNIQTKDFNDCLMQQTKTKINFHLFLVTQKIFFPPPISTKRKGTREKNVCLNFKKTNKNLLAKK
jgi:hypothetical protein